MMTRVRSRTRMPASGPADGGGTGSVPSVTDYLQYLVA
jgi:hypothetical protein